ncbi:GPI mannosyltransferase 2-like isoform X2 [Tripterygium wilfordii]|uniref:GPI mannosyltransferase 2-like isoform X2 n=1 Tax=Tripterygium wilfordii TaxID=458696 RepID=UPI0018F82020|nr:GPI mannosyltransferase 2-like isoform X2 [Tripterygium wilfordii]
MSSKMAKSGVIEAMMRTASVMNSHQTLVLKSAIISRLIVLALIVLWRSLFSPYDTSATLNPSCLIDSPSEPQRLPLLPGLASAVESCIVWDSVYFVRIAQCGYEYEQSYAFLPLLPLCISLLSRTVFAWLVPLIGFRAVLGFSGYVVSNVAFVLAAVYFYRLSVVILKDSEAAFRSSILFCFNPASIFYSSIYSESLYALFSVGGVYHLVSGANSIAVFWFALSGCARSNGVLNAGYFCFQTLHQAYDAVFQKKNACVAMQVLVTGALRCICIFIPFISFQAYGYFNICRGRSLDEMRPWCKASVPLLYSYIQSHYWGVGFLKYFQLKQLPNFLLASPILTLALCSIVSYVKLRPKIVFSLGFRASDEEKESMALFYSSNSMQSSQVASLSSNSPSKKREYHNLRQRKQVIEETDPVTRSVEQRALGKPSFLSVSILPFILHLAFMAATAFFMMHVQVATRFLSASPPLYWFASYITKIAGSGKRWGYVISVYCTAYILLGSLLFSNFYPFT